MKKLLFVFVLGAFVACNDSASTETTTDSTASAMDSTNEAKTDSLSTATDSTINKMDSTTEAKTDSLKK
jgi:hypothetical protein